MTCDPIQSSKVQGWGNFDVTQIVFYRDINVQWTISVLKALGGYSINYSPLAGGRGIWCSPQYRPQPHSLFSVMSVKLVSRNLASSHIILLSHLNAIFAVHPKRQLRRLPRDAK